MDAFMVPFLHLPTLLGRLALGLGLFVLCSPSGGVPAGRGQ